ncbi:hypothetical protein C8Q75DRAFT_722617 [Abortiporus biennis]|nr:hypothetical protein C8Q75DRAFT_722617 [Abortiporus biennis]
MVIFIMSTPGSLELAGVSFASEWCSEKSITAYPAGPLLPLHNKKSGDETNQSLSDASRIDAFMSTLLRSRGTEAMLYISFGSLFWPHHPEKFWTFLDVVIEKRIPFILSHASPFAIVPNEIKAKIERYELGILTPWSPQQIILNNPVTGWFLTHGGHSGTIEAISSGVPMIFWPYRGDQSLNAIHVAKHFSAGYELAETRSEDHGLKISYTRPVHNSIQDEASFVLDNAFGEDGKRRRKNMKELQKKLFAQWEGGGLVKCNLENLVQSMIRVAG